MKNTRKFTFVVLHYCALTFQVYLIDFNGNLPSKFMLLEMHVFHYTFLFTILTRVYSFGMHYFPNLFCYTLCHFLWIAWPQIKVVFIISEILILKKNQSKKPLPVLYPISTWKCFGRYTIYTYQWQYCPTLPIYPIQYSSWTSAVHAKSHSLWSNLTVMTVFSNCLPHFILTVLWVQTP